MPHSTCMLEIIEPIISRSHISFHWKRSNIVKEVVSFISALKLFGKHFSSTAITEVSYIQKLHQNLASEELNVKFERLSVLHTL